MGKNKNLSRIPNAISFDNTLNASFTGSVTSTTFIKSGGTATQFLKADGSVDGTTFLSDYTDTLATVTGRGATTTTLSTFSGGISGSTASFTNFIGAGTGLTDVVHISGTETITGMKTFNATLTAPGSIFTASYGAFYVPLTVQTTIPSFDLTFSTNTTYRHTIVGSNFSSTASLNTLDFKVASGSSAQVTPLVLKGDNSAVFAGALLGTSATFSGSLFMGSVVGTTFWSPAILGVTSGYPGIVLNATAGTVKRVSIGMDTDLLRFVDETNSNATRVSINMSTGALNGTSATFTTAGTAAQVQAVSTSTFGAIGLKNTGGIGQDWVIGADGSGVITGGLGIYSITTSAYRMVINSTGNVGIGTTNPSKLLHVKDSNNSNTAQIKISDLSTSVSSGYIGMFSDQLYISAGGTYSSSWILDGARGVSVIGLGTVNGGSNVTFATAASNSTASEKGRFTAEGFFKASNDGTYLGVVGLYHELRSNASNNFITYLSNSSASPYGMGIEHQTVMNNGTNVFFDASEVGTKRFRVFTNGGVANYSANNVNLSDERTKKEITPIKTMWDTIKALEVVDFKYKDQTHDDFNLGLIAQQVKKVAPRFVNTDGFGKTPKDGIPLMSIYDTDIQYGTLKALQEAMFRIEALETQLKKFKK